MSTTGLASFDKALHTTNHWLNEVSKEMGGADRQQAYHAMRAVLHTLRDRLTPKEAADLSAQLPMFVRGFYYEGWDPNMAPNGLRSGGEFVARVAMEYAANPFCPPELTTRAVLRVLERHVSKGELEDVRRIIPEELRRMWTELTEDEELQT